MKKRWYLVMISIFFASLIIILLFIYIATNKYRDKAIQYLKNYLDSRLTTEIQIRKNDIHFNLFKNFPNASIDLYHILVKSASGPDYKQFNIDCKDTLLYAERVSLIFNLRSIFTNRYELKKIEIRDADLNILLDKERRGNYLILKPDTNNVKKTSISIFLRKIILDNVRLNYNDALTDFIINTFINTSYISGSFEQNNFQFYAFVRAENTYLKVESRQFLFKKPIEIASEILHNQKNYSFNQGNLSIEGIKLKFKGEWNSLKDKYSLYLESKSTSLDRLQNTYLNRFIEKLRYYPIGGNLNFNVKISGSSKSNPNILLHFLLNKGTLQNKNQNISIDNLYIKGSYTNGNNSNAATSLVKIDTMSASSGKSNINLKAIFQNFNSPHIKGIINGNFELEQISALNGNKSKMELTGMVSANIKADGYIPSINIHNIKDLDNVKIAGLMKFDNIHIKSLTNQLPPAIASGHISFYNLKEINLDSINLSFGKSAFFIDGTVSNIPLLNEDKYLIPIYRCKVNSPEFHVEDFLIYENSDKKVEQDAKVEFPDSIIVFASFSARNFSLGKFTATQVNGNIIYQPKTLTINDFSMNSQDGTIKSNIDMTQKEGQFIANCNASLQQINIHTLFYSFNNFGQDIISSDNLGGKISGSVKVSEIWDQHLNPVLEKLSLQSDYVIVNGEIINYQPLLGLSRYIEVEELKHIRFDSLFSSITVKQGIVYIAQTDIQSSALRLTGSGEHHFDNSYIYRVQVKLSDVVWSKARKKKPVNEEFGYEVADEKGTILPLMIEGKGTDYKVKYDRKTGVRDFKEKLKNEKKDWKNILAPDQVIIKPDLYENKHRIDWDDDNDSHPVVKGKATIKDTSNKKDDFTIRWNDE